MTIFSYDTVSHPPTAAYSTYQDTDNRLLEKYPSIMNDNTEQTGNPTKTASEYGVRLTAALLSTK